MVFTKMIESLIRLSLLTLIAVGMVGCDSGPPPNAAARVGTEIITVAEMERALAGADPSGSPKPALVRLVLADLIDQALIINRAKQLGLTVSKAELEQAENKMKSDYGEKGFNDLLLSSAVNHFDWRADLKRRLLIEKTIDREIPQGRPTATETDKSTFKPENDENVKVNVRQILTETKEAATQARDELLAQRPFEQVSADYSKLSGQAGEETGYFGKGEMPPALEKSVWKLPVNGISKVVRTEFGWHVFVLLDRTNSETAEAKRAARMKMQQIRAEKQAAWLNGLRQNTEINVYPERLKFIEVN